MRSLKKTLINITFSLTMAAFTPTLEANHKHDVQEALKNLMPADKTVSGFGYKCEPPKGIVTALINPNLQLFFVLKFEDGDGLVWDLKYRPDSYRKCTDEGNLWMDEFVKQFKHRLRR